MISNFILVAIIVLIVAGAGFYVYKTKKREEKCIGCGCFGTCHSKNCSLEESPDEKTAE